MGMLGERTCPCPWRSGRHGDGLALRQRQRRRTPGQGVLGALGGDEHQPALCVPTVGSNAVVGEIAIGVIEKCLAIAEAGDLIQVSADGGTTMTRMLLYGAAVLGAALVATPVQAASTCTPFRR